MRRGSGLISAVGMVVGVALALSGCQGDVATSQSVTPTPIDAVGTLDLGFATAGAASYQSTIGSGNTRSNGTSITVDNAGRLLVGGNAETATASIYAATVWRIFSNGIPDTAFGTLGTAYTPNPVGSDAIYALRGIGSEVVGVGQVAVSGPPSIQVGLWRYHANGTAKDQAIPDPGTGGPGSAYGQGLAIDGNGNLVVAGMNNSGTDFAVWRYQPIDALDTSFNTSAGAPEHQGFRVVNASGGTATMRDVAVRSGNKIVMVGTDVGGAGMEMVMVAFTAAGGNDGAFNNSGTPAMLRDVGLGLSDTEANAIALQADGTMLVIGYTVASTVPLQRNVALWRVRTGGAVDGTLDPAFGSGGLVTLDGFGGAPNTDEVGWDIKLDAEKRMVIAGTAVSGSLKRLFVARLLSTGALDTTFGTGGYFRDNTRVFNDNLGGPKIAISPNGYINVAGTITVAGNPVMTVWRFK